MVPHTLVLEHVSPATRLLEKRRQMFEVQEALEQQKQEFNNKVIVTASTASTCCSVAVLLGALAVTPPAPCKLGTSVSRMCTVCAAEYEMCWQAHVLCHQQSDSCGREASLPCQQQSTVVQEEVFKRREDGLKKKDLELQESLIRFSKFLQVGVWRSLPQSTRRAACVLFMGTADAACKA